MNANKGFLTSEFYLGLFSVVFTYLNTYFGWHVPPDQILSIAGVVITYIISRTVVKIKTPQEPIQPNPNPPQNAEPQA